MRYERIITTGLPGTKIGERGVAINLEGLTTGGYRQGLMEQEVERQAHLFCFVWLLADSIIQSDKVVGNIH